MFEAKRHIRNFRHFLLMWFVLFALSPCVVKEALFSIANVEYAKPTNKTKTTAPTSACQYSQNDNQQISVTRKATIGKRMEPVSVSVNPYFVARSIGINAKYSKTFSGNSPPMYILYKRLKLDIA